MPGPEHGDDRPLELELAVPVRGARTVSTVTGEEIPPELLGYHGLRRVVMAVEDDERLRRDMADALFVRFLPAYEPDLVRGEDRKSVKEGKLVSNDGVGLAVVNSPVAALDVLSNVVKYSPHVCSSVFFLDLNMGSNKSTAEGGRPGERTPTEGLFYSSERGDDRNSVFRRFLHLGAMVVMYTGMPSQLMQSPIIMDVEKDYPNTTLFVGTKSAVDLGDLVELVHRLPENPQSCREYVDRFRRERERSMRQYADRMKSRPEATWTEAERRYMGLVKVYGSNPWTKYDVISLIEAMKRKDSASGR